MRALFATAAAIAAIALGIAPGAGARSGRRAHAAASPLTALRSALNSGMAQVCCGSSALVVDLTTGKRLYANREFTPRLPASVEKLYTTSTALLRFGPRANLVTSIYGAGRETAAGTWIGKLYIRGGGDPTFGSATYDTYAYGANTGATMQRLVANLIRTTGIHAVHGAIVGDESYFDSLRGTIATNYQGFGYLEGMLSALIYNRGLANDQGTAEQTRPALFTAQTLAAALQSAGVSMPSSDPVYTASIPSGARLLTVVHSPRISTLIKLTNTPSDNFFAEMLLKGIGARFGGAGTSAAGVSVVKAEVAKVFGIHPAFDDGSGLSYDDHTTVADVVTLLERMASNTNFTSSLAVAGESGTLIDEMVGSNAQGKCRGKTGTLSAVSNLVGYCTAADGHTLAFAFLMGNVDPYGAHPIQDQMVEAIQAYKG